MPEFILPSSFICVLSAFRGCFGTPSYANFQLLVAGWVHCLGRRTVTAVVLAAGGVGWKHISVFHRFFSRAQWSLDAVGKVLFGLALAWLPSGQPLYLLGDDTLARKAGKCISLASIHHDPLLSTARKPFFSFGHVWVVLAIWVPLPMGVRRGFALPVLFRLYVGAKRGGETGAHGQRGTGARQAAAVEAHSQRTPKTKLELLREMTVLAAGWAENRTCYLVVDSAYAARMTLENRPGNVEVISRLRMDAALWTPPPTREPGQRGRPRKRGDRLPNPKAMAATRQHWHQLPVQLYGRCVTTEVFRCTALWYVALSLDPVVSGRDQPLRIILVRDPSGLRRDEAFFCTDNTVSAAFILEAYARRWTLEVTFHDSKQFLGFEDPQNQTRTAVGRTAPMAGIVYALVLLWYAEQLQKQPAPQANPWPNRPWYRRKATPSFLDMLTALRLEGWRTFFLDPPSHIRWMQNSPASWPDAVFATA